MNSFRVLLARARPYLLIWIGLLPLFAVLARLAAVRVGDASEYYAMLLAFDGIHRPWMTAEPYARYQELYQSNSILGLLPTDTLAHAFEALRVNNTADFNHFWLYSLLAELSGTAARLLGIHPTVHQNFVVLHYLLAVMVASIGYHTFSWRGVSAVLLILLVSPLFWFSNKAHTEFMTVCLVLGALAWLMREKYLPAALLLALAATQNPSFALLAGLALGMRVWLQRARAYNLAEVAMVVATVLAVLMHPVYYFLRYGVPTPQLLAGGAALGANLSTFYVWFVDPDLGLFPNWPLGLLALLLGAFIVLRRQWRSDTPATRPFLLFCLAYLAINLFAHSSTTNLNSGATPGLARYALWYMPLMLPVLLQVLGYLRARPLAGRLTLALVVLLGGVSLQVNDPRRFERYTTPSLSSRALQKHLPGLYNPPPEVFAERYSGHGENVYAQNVRAVVGPDCRKALIMGNPDSRAALAPPACGLDKRALDRLVNNTAVHPGAPYYLQLPATIAPLEADKLAAGPHRVAAGGEPVDVLGEGWSVPESWGVWSDGHAATLTLPCGPAQYFGNGKPFTLLLNLRPFQQQALRASYQGKLLWEGVVNEVDQEVVIKVPGAPCEGTRMVISLALPGAVSPQSLKLSGDPRLLGVGLSRFEVRAE
ncbi:hypothetical protein [Massilia sp. CF038]|uniref:hypothetical protein n=1 Tax=Massilia sp. CF038 TaxID=1881045 RepID=UPI0009158072|nr:hypothetical protein [Massilia sp. CF038]SHG39716.1 hypothetical protein SAMN05428948_0255 [Massilia sp. CF038]